METKQKEGYKFLSNSEEIKPEYVALDDSQSEPKLKIRDHGGNEILYKLLPINGKILNGDIRDLADYINTNGLNLPARKCIKNLVFKTHFQATKLLFEHLNPKKIVRKTDNIEHVGRTLSTLIYKAKTKYTKKHEHNDKNKARTLIYHNALENLSINVTVFCGKMYRENNKMRENHKNTCAIL